MSLDWSILRSNGPVDIAGNFARGYAIADKIVSQVHERNALGHLATNPGDPDALAQLYQANPEMGAHFEARAEQRRKALLDQQKEAAAAAVGQQYASGDAAGAQRAALSSGDFDLAKTLSDMGDADRKRVMDRFQAAGPLAYQASKLPPDARAQYLNANREVLKAAGWSDDELNRFDPTDAHLAGIIGISSKLQDLVSADKPEIRAVEPGGGLYSIGGGKVSTLVAPNDGSHSMGAPVSGGGGGSITQKNNPGALRKPGSTEFQTFATEGEGIQAQHALLGRYMQNGLNNVSAIVERYAPRKSRGGDNTDAQVNNYISYVADRLNVDPNAPIPPAAIPQLGQAMREFETGHRAKSSTAGHSPSDIRAAAQRAIAAGADPSAVKARAAAQGVTL